MILVTGARGFVGTAVVARLLDSGTTVRAWLSREDAGFATRFPQVETVFGDLLDSNVATRAMRGVHAVVHLAAKNIDHDGRGFERVNVGGTRCVCDAATGGGVERFLYLSSVGVYGHGTRRDADESTPLAPDTDFSRSKAAAEAIVLDHHRAGRLAATVLRHRFVYGPGDAHVLPRLIKAARSYPFWISGGRARMSLIHVDDLATVIGLFSAPRAAAVEPGPVYHVTDGSPVSYRAVISTLCDAFGYRAPRFSLPFWLLYVPVRARERLLGIDPELTRSSVSSIRLKLVARDNYFSNRRLVQRWPEVRLRDFPTGFAQARDYYADFS